ncbi:S8 family serine peptidase [Streptomyces sp. 891-h]|uniref:S8 family serine peptidase n=1 Tax=Streptomyces sp. 891-h TaxID=2720714 RepID=UPI001FAA2D47|nr:S8 family serine peptidase [Streptomyces sp. 891-h]UNZ17060.1 S8 family serine peptidase [Streptomyces sp. 891-h]
MQAEKIWKVSTGSGVRVAVIDGGVDPSSKALEGRVLPGKDLSGAPGDETRDESGHGTTMAEYIAGSGKDGSIKGLAPDAKIIPFRTTIKGMKGADTTKDNLGKAIRAAADSDAKIINMSLGGAPHPAVKEAVRYATNKGKLLIASTGNDAKKGNHDNYPAAYPDVVAVAATDKAGKVADYSNYSQHTVLSGPSVDLPAWCDGKKQKYCPGGGTSTASALVSASAALIWSHHPDWTSNQVLRVMIKTAGLKGDKPSKYVGYGEVRPRMNLLEGEGDPGDPDISPLTGERTLNTKPDKSSSEAKGSDKEAAPDKVKVADSEREGGGNSGLWVAAGAGAAVLVIGGGTALAIRRARRG